jgi:hypothetical protein
MLLSSFCPVDPEAGGLTNTLGVLSKQWEAVNGGLFSF